VENQLPESFDHLREFLMTKHRLFGFMTTVSTAILLTACSGLGLKTDNNYDNKDKDKLYKNGSIVSDEGGFDLLGAKDKKTTEGAGIGVNGFLWRATLDTIAFMPIVSADPFGGVITTDWYSAPGTPNERLKVNVFILDRELRADGVRVSAFRQTRDSRGAWSDAPVASTTASSLESTILTRARQLKLAQREMK
jgi:hypothetical protein